MMGRETLAESPFESASVAFCVVDGGGDVLECKNFAKTEKNAFDRGGDHMYLKCKKFAKTKKWIS